jgi:hypothetical protein
MQQLNIIFMTSRKQLSLHFELERPALSSMVQRIPAAACHPNLIETKAEKSGYQES